MRALKDILCMSLDFTHSQSLTPHINHMLKGLMALFTEEKAKLEVVKDKPVGNGTIIQTQFYRTSHYTKLP